MTTAVRNPSAVGCVVNVTVNEFAEVTEVTIPKAPLLNATVLLAGVVEKPEPVIIKVVALIARLGGLTGFTVGAITVPTCTGEPLLPPLVVTTAVRVPLLLGGVIKETINCVKVAELTIPTAPRLSATVLFAAIGIKLVPLMVSVVAVVVKLAELGVMVGAPTMVAT